MWRNTRHPIRGAGSGADLHSLSADAAANGNPCHVRLALAALSRRLKPGSNPGSRTPDFPFARSRAPRQFDRPRFMALGAGYPSPGKRHDHPEIDRRGWAVTIL
nr:MAG TPA: hypothetical protein [Caudoviricetes sp.]